MKVLIVNKFLYPNGGSETYIFEIGRCLEAMGHEVQYFGMEHKGRIVGNHAEVYTPDMEFHDEAGVSAVRRIGRKISKLTYPFRIIYSRDSARRITRVLEDFEPDVVHFNNINFQLTPSVIEAVTDHDIRHGAHIQTVYTAHDSQWVCPGHLLRVPSDGRRCFDCEGGKYINCVRNRCIHGSRIRSLLGALEGFIYRHRNTYGLIDTVICPSAFMKDRLETHPELTGKCVTLHNFVNVECIQGGTVAGQERYVLYFGRFSEEKGIATLIKACRALPDVKFVFAGSGPLEADIAALDNAENVGFKSGDELYELISGAQFSVFPSECHENCSFTVMESIACGTPIIASSTGGTPELVSDGINGSLFEAGNVTELTDRIRDLWIDRECLDKLRAGCASTHFMSVDEYCRELLKIYEGNETGI